MLVKAPFTYKATVLRPRKRTYDEVLYRGYIDVAIPEVAPEDAPVVLQAAEGSDLYIPPHRFHDETLWKPWGTSLRDDGPHKDGRQPTRTAFVTDAGAGDVGNLLHRTDAYGDGPRNAMTMEADEANVREVRESTRDDVMSQVVEDARDMLLVGDEVWVRAVEPVFEVKRFAHGDHVRIEVFSGERDQYRLDQGDLIARAEGGRPTRMRRGEVVEHDDHEPPMVAVLRPDLLRARTTENAVGHVGEALVTRMYERLKEASPDDLASYASVRDGLRGMSADLLAGKGCDAETLTSILAQGVNLLKRLSGVEERHTCDMVRCVTIRIEADRGLSPSQDLVGFTP